MSEQFVTPHLSFVIPVHNEQESLRELAENIRAMSDAHGYSYEMIFVDDGSTDESFAIIEALTNSNPRIRALQFRRNFGQTAALSAGIAASRAPLVVTLDADLQNDPSDVPTLLQTLEQGFDVVSGWRKDRQDSLSKKIPSKFANKIISWITGVKLSDYGCTLKVYRRQYLEDVPLYGEMHRFIPVLAAWNGARVTEVAVHHHPRKFGRSHYGLRRTGKVMLDLLTVKFLHSYIARPMHFFGAAGMWLLGAGFVCGITSIILKIFDIRSFVDTPLPLLTVFFLIIGAQFMLMGLLAELLTRIYFGRSGRTSYRVHKTINIDLQ